MNKLSVSLLFVGLIAGFIQNATSNVIGVGNGIGCAGNIIANGLAQNKIITGNPIGNVASLGLGNALAASNAIAANALAANAAACATNEVNAIGTGDVAIGGQLSVGGTTALTGKVPVIGYVTFEGTVPAGGLVSVAPGCECTQICL
ncbi:hypothetical protein NE865_09198 [Phthorimaea operculella]|nr:hypothetical protein NE865_09198 [Phthorimaea operculella]